MPYRIRPDHDFTREVRRLTRNQLEQAIETLELQPHGLHQAIHEARKRFKRVRAIYRLTAQGRKEFRLRENARLRDTARTLSVFRDAAALLETVQVLEANARTQGEREALTATAKALAERRDRIAATETDLSDKVAAAIDESRKAIAAIDELKFNGAPCLTAKRLSKAWAKALGRAHSALEGCHELADPELFHDLRKAAQTYWMNLSLLREVWPSAMRAKRIEVKALVDMLGHEHDISILADVLDHEPELLGDQGLSHLLGLIIRVQQDVRQKALELADKVFAQTPADEPRIIRKLWLLAAER